MTQVLSVSLPTGALMVTGTVNSVPATWTLSGPDTWSATVPRAEDDVYHVALTIVGSNGLTTQTSLTLYYGLSGLITDRTQADVNRVRVLAEKGWDGMTEEEQSEWKGDLKGAYNVSDMNRVNAAMSYISGRLEGFGYDNGYADQGITWTDGDKPNQDQLTAYLDNVKAVRAALAVLPTTPPAPDDMAGLTYIEANNIEQILLDVDDLLTRMSAAWYYSGDLYSAEV